MSGYALIPASYVALLRDGGRGTEVLLLRRSGTGYFDDHWALLAGHVEEFESATDAGCREALEESGVIVAPADLQMLTVMQRCQRDGGPVEQRVDWFFSTRLWTGDPTVQEPDKASDMGWFPLSELPDPVVPHERLVLEGLARGDLAAYLAYGFA
ncbi:MAG: NUDIX domain-containing protein [Nocardioidaceae bacterium]